MKKQIQNPLLESLMRQANLYGNPLFEQKDKPVKNTQFAEFVNYLSETGRNMVQAYQSAIGTYPATKYKSTYMAAMPGKIRAIAKAVGTSSGDKTINVQLDLLLDSVKKELTDFLQGSKEDKDYVEYLLGWRNALQKGFNQYELAIKSIEKYVKSKEELGQAKMDDKQFAALGDSLEKIASSMEEEVANLTIANQGLENSSYTFDDAKSELLEKFIETNILVNFSKFTEVVNEGKGKERRQAKRAASQIIEDCNNLKAQVNSLVILIASRESYHGGETNKFKSSGMNVQFADIAKQMDSIINQLEGKDKRDLVMMDMTELSDSYEKYSTLFNDLKEKYDTEYTEEYSKIKSIDIVNTASPDVAKYIENANSNFNSLSSLSLDAQRAKANADKAKLQQSADAAAVAKEPAADKKESTGKKVESKPITQKEAGTKRNDDVKAFQETVIEKYAKDKDMVEEPEYKDLKAALDKGQGGIYGKRTIAMVKYLKDGLGIKDGKGAEITQELIDAINKDVIKESVRFSLDRHLFEFDHEAARKARSGGGGGSTSKKEAVKKAANKDITPEESSSKSAKTFACIKKIHDDIKISGGKAVRTGSVGDVHTYNADGGFSYYWKAKDKTMKGKWECLGDDYKATTEEDNDFYLGSAGNWQSNLDAAAKTKAEEDKKAQEVIANKGKEAARKILIAMSGDTEDENAVYKVFKEEITTAELYNATRNAWNSWWPSSGDLKWAESYWKAKSVTDIDKKMAHTSGSKTGYGFEAVFTSYFKDSELSRLNNYLPAGVKKI